MTNKKHGGNVTQTVREIAEPLAAELGLRVWDVRFVKEGAEHYLRIFIDREMGSATRWKSLLPERNAR